HTLCGGCRVGNCGAGEKATGWFCIYKAVNEIGAPARVPQAVDKAATVILPNGKMTYCVSFTCKNIDELCILSQLLQASLPCLATFLTAFILPINENIISY
ncbi:MAG: hypothetical protein RSA41_08665, partial [Christensenella sp.]